MKFLYSKTSIKYLQTLEQKVACKIVETIERLPAEGDVRRLKGKKIRNIYRLRMGKYRVIFYSGKEFIKVVKIDTRGDVYK